MVAYVIDAIEALASDRIYVVVGYKATQVMDECGSRAVHFVMQQEQLGTGHAVMQCDEALSDFSGTVVVLNGDVPCLRESTVRQFVGFHESRGAAATVLTAVLDDASGYGRIAKDAAGALVGIVEEKDADDETKQIREINSGLFCFDKEKLFLALGSIDRDNAQNEFYLTDVIERLQKSGEGVYAYRVDDSWEVAGVNTDAELETVRKFMRGAGR